MRRGTFDQPGKIDNFPEIELILNAQQGFFMEFSRRTVFFSAVVIIMLISFTAYAAELQPYWILYGTNERGDVYYNKNSIRRGNDGIIIVDIKYTYTDKGANEIQKFLKINTPAKYALERDGFDCSTKSMHVFRTIYFGSDFSQLRLIDWNPGFVSIQNGSLAETMLEILCSTANNVPEPKQTEPKKRAAKKPNNTPNDEILNKYN